MQQEKIVIIGAGHVGSHCADALAHCGVCREIVLTDILPDKAAAQALDVADSVSYLPQDVTVRAGEISECADAALVVVAIGEARKPGQTRLDMLGRSIEMLKELTAQLRPLALTCPVVSITNPADIVADYLRKQLSLPRTQCFSTGTLLDTARLIRAIAQAIADKLGLKLEVTDIAFDSIIPGIQTGKYDMGMAGMTVTDERKEQVNFSDSYATGVQVVIVKDDSPITSVDDLFADGASTVVGTQAGTTGFIYATSDIEDAGLGTVKSFGKTTDAVEALKNGQVDCVILDNEPAKALVAANEGLHILDTEYAVEDYAIAIAKENTDLLEKVNKALSELTADGTLQSIVDKYIGK